MTSKAELVRTNLVHATEKHRGIDGRMRFLCGPEISIVLSSRSTYIVPAKRLKQKSQIQHVWQRREVWSSLHVSDISCKEQRRRSRRPMHGLALEQENQGQEPKLQKIIPTFRTPPQWINACSFQSHGIRNARYVLDKYMHAN